MRPDIKPIQLINMRIKYGIIVTLALCLSLAHSFGQVNRPNFLFIIVDDLRPELGAYGCSEVKSPNIDRLAAEGFLFNRAYCNVPVCGASRASLLTGLRPLWPGRFTSFRSRVDKDSPGTITFPELFRNKGYTTISNGKIFHHNNDQEKAWSEPPWRPQILTAKVNVANSQWVDPSSKNYVNEKSGSGPYFESPDVPDTAYFDGQVAEKTVRDLKRLAKADNPFFLAVGFIRPHLPFNAPKKYYDLYSEVSIADNRYFPKDAPKECCGGSGEVLTYAKTEQYNSIDFHHEARKGYYASVSYVDAQIGKVLGALKETGKANNTIVVLIGDHGWLLGEHNLWAKHNVLKQVIGAPMIIKLPGMASKKINQVVEFVDLYPTLCALANIKIPEQLQGENMLPMIKGKDQKWRDMAFVEYGGARNVTTERYSYTEWVKEEYKGDRMLFDHKTDPEENVNVVNRPEYKAVADSLSIKLKQLYEGMSNLKKK